MLPHVQSRFCREVNKKFFLQKTAGFSLRAKQTNKLKRVTDKHSHEIFSDCKRGPGSEAPAVGRFLQFCSKKYLF